MKYCNNCKQLVEPRKEFGWAPFILLAICTLGCGAIIYLIYHFALKEKTCPMCNSDNWGVAPTTTIPTTTIPTTTIPTFCPNCGAKINSEDGFCAQCGRKI